MNKIIYLKETAELLQAFPLMKELRPHLSEEQFIQYFFEMQNIAGYTLAAMLKDNKMIGLMGFRFLIDYVRGEHLYIDDLIIEKEFRSHGIGAELLSHAEEVAKAKGVATLRLATGLDNIKGMKFYERNGWNQRSVIYIKKI